MIVSHSAFAAYTKTNMNARLIRILIPCTGTFFYLLSGLRGGESGVGSVSSIDSSKDSASC